MIILHLGLSLMNQGQSLEYSRDRNMICIWTCKHAQPTRN